MNDLVSNKELALLPVMNIALAVERRNQIVGFVKEIMVDGIDFGTIPGNTKQVLFKPGAEKLNSFFGLMANFTILEKVEDWTGKDHDGEPFFYYFYRCRLSQGDVPKAEGDGSCSSFESKYRYRKMARICPICQEEQIIKGKDEYGGGWLCWKKMGGCGAKFKDGDQAIEGQETGRKTNPDVCDQVNTIQKMAQKRALVAATLLAVNASEFFTQDLEDYVVGDYTVVVEGNHPPQQDTQPPQQTTTSPPRQSTQSSNQGQQGTTKQNPKQSNSKQDKTTQPQQSKADRPLFPEKLRNAIHLKAAKFKETGQKINKSNQILGTLGPKIFMPDLVDGESAEERAAKIEFAKIQYHAFINYIQECGDPPSATNLEEEERVSILMWLVDDPKAFPGYESVLSQMSISEALMVWEQEKDKWVPQDGTPTLKDQLDDPTQQSTTQEGFELASQPDGAFDEDGEWFSINTHRER